MQFALILLYLLSQRTDRIRSVFVCRSALAQQWMAVAVSTINHLEEIFLCYHTCSRFERVILNIRTAFFVILLFSEPLTEMSNAKAIPVQA
jgi:hypothetical protein